MLKAIRQHQRKAIIIVAVVALLVMAVPMFAQDISTTTIQLSASDITPNLFQGANIILVSLGAVMFLIAGLSFGGRLLRFVVDAIRSFS